MKSIKEQVEYLRDFVVDEKNALFDRLIQERTDYVTVVLEDLFQSHNQSAVMRSADCYGIQHVHLIENRNSYDMTSTVSQGARDWLSIHRHKELENNTQATIDQLRAEGYRILATTPHANDIFVDDIDLEKGKMAFFFGTELTGLSDLVIGQADEFVIVLRVGAQTADGDGHTALKHTVELRLRTVGFLKVMQELPGSRRQLQFLCAARKRCPVCQ